MIGIAIGGGLGNQMFQYAFILNKSLQKKKLFYLDKSGTPIALYKYFKFKKNLFSIIDSLFFNYDGFKLFFCHYLRNGFYFLIRKFFIKNYVSSPKGTDYPFTLDDTLSDSTFYNGYYQSPWYFKEHEAKVLEHFELKDSILKSYDKNYSFLKNENKIVTIHIRKTDFLNLNSYNLGDSDLSLPYSYYHQLIKKIHEDDNYYIFISDSPEFLSEEFNYIERKYISHDTEITDFQHMLNADICVIANSTFSWWAAYLNKKKNKTIYCPQYYLGFKVRKEYPIGIYPDSWNQVII